MHFCQTAASSGVAKGGKRGHLPPGAALRGRQSEVGGLRNSLLNEMSVDASNYDLQNVEC